MNDLFVLGANHLTAGIAVRERLSLHPREQDDVLARLLASRLVEEAVVLCTCNRVEVYGVSPEPVAQERVLEVLQAAAGVPSMENSSFYLYRGCGALTHLFRVASSLDSQIVGETHILGQVKESYERSRLNGATSKWLNTFFQKSFQVAKKVRTETNIALLPVSTGSCAAALAEKILGELEGRKLLAVGAGQIGATVARHFSKRGVGLMVSNRTRARAEALSAMLDGRTIEFERWKSLLVDVDVVVFATQSPHPLLTCDEVSEMMRLRRNRPLLLLDMSVPRNVDPDVARLESVFLFDVDEIQSITTAHRSVRIDEAEKAEELIGQSAHAVWKKMNAKRGYRQHESAPGVLVTAGKE
jgi:glutamyl-tRNA reductase